MLFNDRGNVLHEIVRAHDLFISARPSIMERDSMDVAAAFGHATGLSAETMWRGLYAIYAAWKPRQLADLDHGRFVVSRSRYLETIHGMSPAEREHWFKLAMWEVTELQAAIRRRYSLQNPRFMDVLPFEMKPLVAFGDSVYCTSMVLFDRLAGASIQHRLLDPEVFSPSERHAFLDTRGHRVERYTAELLARTFGNRFLSEQSLQKCAQGASVCDGLVMYADSVILIECKTASPLLATRHAEGYDEYRDKWHRAVQKAATQFDSTIALLNQGVFADLGILPSMLKRIFPVMLVYELPVSFLTYRSILEHDLKQHPLAARIAGGQVAPLQLQRIDEIEMWEVAAERGRSVMELLRDKTADPRLGELTFRDFVTIRREPFRLDNSTWHKRRFEEIFAATREFLLDRGMPERNPDN